MSNDITFSGLVYGNAGSGKTFFAATFPKPAKVMMFDPHAKGLAYLQQGTPGPILRMPDGGAFQYVTQPDTGELLVEIEYFMDLNPQNIGIQKHPCAYERFQDSLHAHMDEGWMTQEPEPRPYASVILDSYTFCELACIRMHQYKINPAPGGVQDSKHNQMQWAGNARGVLQTDIMATFPWIPCHNLVLAHVDDKRFDEQDKTLWGISAVGKLGSLLPSAFAEVYFMYAQYNEKEQCYENLLMTERNNQYICQTHIGVQNPCKPTWNDLWK